MTQPSTPKLLILHNGSTHIPTSRIHERFQEEGLEVSYYWAANDEFPESVDGYHGVLLTGSPHGAYEDIPWIRREHEFIRGIAGRSLPMLGICFGSQILASALCGRDQVFRRRHCEVDYTNLYSTGLAEKDLLMNGLGDAIYMYVWHNDEVRHGHPDMRILAVTPDCPNHIWRFQNKPFWGIQGHPELTREQALNLFEENRARLERDGADVEDLKRKATDTEEAKALLMNFVGVVRAQPVAPNYVVPQ